jgi:hypothetical protein
MNLPWWKHHGFPVVITSPENSYCIINEAPCVPVGLEGYTGQESLHRWRAMFRWMLQQPFEYFLLHESDSICLRKELPWELYRPGVLFSNEMPDNGVPATQAFYCVAPLFMHRNVIERMLEVSKTSADRPPYHGDRWVGQMVEEGEIAHQAFSPGIGCGTLSRKERPQELDQILQCVRDGAFMIHGVKTPDVLQELLQARRR